MAWAAISQNRDTQGKMDDVLSLKMAAVKICQGGLVGVAPSTGYLNPLSGTASMPYSGVSYEGIDNSSGAAGDLECRVSRKGAHVMKCSGADQTWLQQEVYMDLGATADNATVTKTAPANLGCKVGRVVEVISATEVRISIDGYAGVTQAAAS
ncbi:MAG: hypothetical protein ABFD83_14820 [Armatimonadota bacterium]